MNLCVNIFSSALTARNASFMIWSRIPQGASDIFLKGQFTFFEVRLYKELINRDSLTVDGRQEELEELICALLWSEFEAKRVSVTEKKSHLCC